MAEHTKIVVTGISPSDTKVVFRFDIANPAPFPICHLPIILKAMGLECSTICYDPEAHKHIAMIEGNLVIIEVYYDT